MTLTREHARALEMSLQTFARQWGTLLSSRLGALTGVTLEQVEIRTYDEYVSSLPSTTTSIVLQEEFTRAVVVLQLPNDLSMTLIDCLLGGPASELKMPFREMTDIEWSLMKDMVEHAVTELTYGLQSIMPTKFEIRSVKYSPQFMQLIPATEPVLVGRFDMQIGPVEATLSLMIEAEQVLTQLRAADDVDGRTDEEQSAHAAAHRLLSARMQEVPLPLSVRFRGRTMGAGEIAALEVGSVISLGHSAQRPLDVVVADKVLAHAAIGVNGTRVACLVVSTEEEA